MGFIVVIVDGVRREEKNKELFSLSMMKWVRCCCSIEREKD
jgi:hypothetical protein